MFRVTELEIRSASEDPLKPGDFASLTNLNGLAIGIDCQDSIYSSTLSEPLPTGVFNGLDNLLSLNVRIDSDCYADEGLALPTGVFNGLSTLRYLDLRGNGLTRLPIRLFDGLVDLQVIDLSDNPFIRLPPGVFKNLTKLQRLHLDERYNSATSQYEKFEIEVASIGVAANLEGQGFVIVDK